MNIYVVITMGGFIGMAVHAWRTIANINKRHDKATFKMVVQEYWESDKISIVVSIFSFLAILFCISEFVDLNHLQEMDNTESLKDKLFHFKLANFIKTFSIIAGYFADSIVYGGLGVAEKRLVKRFAEQEAETKP